MSYIFLNEEIIIFCLIKFKVSLIKYKIVCTFVCKIENKQLKRVVIIVLSILILSPSFGSLFIYASFKINQKEIAKTICVQRKLAYNNCNGRCEFQKSIKKYSDNEKKIQDSLKDKVELVYVQNTAVITPNVIDSMDSKDNSSIIFVKKPIGVTDFTYHPPIYFT